MKNYWLKLGSSFLRFYIQVFAVLRRRVASTPLVLAHVAVASRARMFVCFRRRSVVHVHACGRPVLSFCSLLRLPSCGLDLSASSLFGSLFVFRVCFLVFCFFWLFCFVLVICSYCCLQTDCFFTLRLVVVGRMHPSRAMIFSGHAWARNCQRLSLNMTSSDH